MRGEGLRVFGGDKHTIIGNGTYLDTIFHVVDQQTDVS